LKEIIHQFKYRGHLSLARPLARHLGDVYAQFAGHLRSDVMIPVPLHRARERERGFNQAAELAKGIVRTLEYIFDIASKGACHAGAA
jgi:predicted amidophosphoribosyltransferase